jgi:hypothetical protein
VPVRVTNERIFIVRWRYRLVQLCSSAALRISRLHSTHINNRDRPMSRAFCSLRQTTILTRVIIDSIYDRRDSTRISQPVRQSETDPMTSSSDARENRIVVVHFNFDIRVCFLFDNDFVGVVMSHTDRLKSRIRSIRWHRSSICRCC